MRASIITVLIAACLVCSTAWADGPFRAGGPATTDNDASCDISLLPAATLLLPYFEVDLAGGPGGTTTIFTVTNVTNLPQIAHVTLWTDLAYPVIDFNIYLTGYDVQSINLYDVIARGRLAPDDGTGSDVSPVGELSGSYRQDFDNPRVIEVSCVDLPVELPQPYVNRMRSAFTTGKATAAFRTPACERIGEAHANAVGYATMDVVSVCSTTNPTTLSYFADEILFDNVLIGDYLQVNGRDELAQGGPLVHIRAIPEGGTPRERREDTVTYRVNSPRTFYSRYQHPARPRFDARQPLPTLFAARFLSAGEQYTSLKVWREGREVGTDCTAYAHNRMNVADMVRFDEDENPETHAPDILICAPINTAPVMPVVSMPGIDNEVFFPYGEDSGWIYLNMDYCNRDDIAGQAWVVSSMRAGNRYAADLPAQALGNGCSAPVGPSEATGSGGPIAPAPNIRP